MNINKFNDKVYSVALYIRLSKEDGDKEESESVTNQRKILKAYIKDNKNYVIFDEYIDDGYSGTNFNRPSFKRMLEDIENKKVNMVITKSLSRLGRDYIETGRYIESYFPEHEVRYISILDDVDTELDKNCDTAAFKNIMNDFYAKETSRNVKKTKNRKKKEGFYYISVAPFGYDKIDKTGKIEINSSQAEIVKRIFKLFLEGYGTYQISTMLNNEKILSPGLQMNMTGCIKNKTGTTDKWTHTTIKRILTNQIYIGTCIQNKTRKISYKSKKIIRLPEEEYTITRNHHEAIIDEETFNLVQKMFEKNKNTKIKENDPLLKSLLYCSHCHNRLQVVKKQDKYKDKITIRRYIRCGTAIRPISNSTCFKQYMNYDKFEPLILEKISEIFEKYLNAGAFDEKITLEKLISMKSNRGKIEEKQKQIKNELDIVNKKIKILYTDKLNGIIEEQDYSFFSDGLLKERHKLEIINEDVEKELRDFDNQYQVEKIKNEMREVFKKVIISREYTKDLLQQLINKIEVDKDKNILIYFNFYELNSLGGYTNAEENIS